MKKVFTLVFALFMCSAAFAQFTNAKSGSRGGNSGGTDSGDMSYKGFVEAGYAIGLGDDKDGDKPEIGRFDISTSHGVQINKIFFMGLGTGFKWFSKKSESYFNIPIFTDLRVNFLESKVSPFVGCKIGYAVGIEKDHVKFSGFLCTPAFGLRFGSGLVSIGYDIQKGKVYDEKFTANGLVFKVGIGF